MDMLSVVAPAAEDWANVSKILASNHVEPADAQAVTHPVPLANVWAVSSVAVCSPGCSAKYKIIAS